MCSKQITWPHYIRDRTNYYRSTVASKTSASKKQNMSSISSDDSLGDLPLPYDISSAVSRALRINSTDGTTSPRERNSCPTNVCPSNSLTAVDTSSCKIKRQDMNAQFNCLRNSSTASCVYENALQTDFTPELELHQLPNQPIYPEQFGMEAVDAWGDNTVTVSICSSSESMLDSQNDMEQLDQFCNYIVSNSEEELPIESSTAPVVAPIYPAGAYPGPSYYYQYPVGVDTPPRKKPRSTSSYEYYNYPGCSSTESSPDKSICQRPQKVHWTMKLENALLWRQFDEIGTEMVITKGGRRMFPSPVVSLSGLDPDATYSLTMEIIPADNKRYKFLQTEWVPVGRAEKKQVYREYTHPDSPNTGSFWMEKHIHFKVIKLTNNKTTNTEDQIILNSMQKYQPYLKLTCVSTGVTQSFCFPETVFIAVTAYQNSKITQLKINNNPYARAFRESIPGEPNGLEKKGGHYKDRDFSHSPSHVYHAHLSPGRGPSPGRAETPTSNNGSKCTSNTSVESGFESSDSGEAVQHDHSLSEMKIITQPNPFIASSLTYWADDNSLWNPNLISPISPDPLMDSTSSFSEPYLQQSTRDPLYEDISPVKPIHNRGLSLLLDTTPLQLELDTLDEDDVFL